MISASLLAVFKLFCVNFLETFVVLSAILLPIKSPIASAVFSIPLFDVVLSASVVNLWLEFNTAFLLWLYYLMTKIKFILSPFSTGLLFWSVNHTLMHENSDLDAFKTGIFL